MADPHRDPALYLRIAADLRQRIARGELRPGDRVPSTRQLQKTWSVALATAARALTTLSQEGVLRAEPRFGYVVAARRTSGTPGTHNPQGALTSERIVRAAIELADAEGLTTLSMRGVAARLHVPTMSIYRHVENRDALLLHMVDATFAEEPLPSQKGRGWRPLFEQAARLQWAMYRRHPWLPQVMSLTRPLLLDNVVRYADWMFAAMAELPIDAETRMLIHMTLYSYVRGIAMNLESERQAEAETGLTEQQWMDTQASTLAALATSQKVPAFARMLNELGDGFDLELEQVFEFGLQPLLDGLVKIVEGGKRRLR